MQLTYIGIGHVRTFSADDLTRLGLDDHNFEEGLVFRKGQPVEVDDKVGELLAGQFRREFDAIDAPELVEELTRDELIAEAKELRIPRTGSMNKEQLAEAILAARQRLAAAEDDN